jgi:hypothetical protein
MIMVEMDRQAAMAQADVAGPRMMEKLRVMANPSRGAKISPRFPVETKEKKMTAGFYETNPRSAYLSTERLR